MEKTNMQLVLFSDINKAADAIEKMLKMGIRQDEMEVISGLPFSHHILGRPEIRHKVSLFAITGFLVGAVISLLLNFGTPLLYPVHVGNFPLLSTPPTLVLTFEISMLGLMVFSFLGVIWECRFPRLKPVEYDPSISDGKIGILFTCEPGSFAEVREALLEMGAETVNKAGVLE